MDYTAPKFKERVRNLRFLGYTNQLVLREVLNEIITLQIIGLITLNRLLMVYYYAITSFLTDEAFVLNSLLLSRHLEF